MRGFTSRIRAQGQRVRSMCGKNSDPIGDALRTAVVAYWTLNESSAGSMAVQRNDSGPNSYHLTDNNTTASGTGQIGNGASLVAADNTTLTRPAGSDLDIGTGDYSFSFWMNGKPDIWFAKGNGNTSGGYYFYAEGASVKLQFHDGTSSVAIQSTSDFTDTNWHHIVVRLDRDGDGTIYGDGSLEGTTDISSNTGAISDASAPFTVGKHPTFGLGVTGIIDELAAFNKHISTGEIAYLWNSGAGRSLY